MEIETINDDFIDIKFITPTNANSKSKRYEEAPYRDHDEDLDQK
jgi:hypothetical protein